MKNVFFGILLTLLLLGAIWFVSYIVGKSNTPDIVYETETAEMTDIYKKTMATGTILPRKEINVKSAVSGIVQELYVGTGSEVKKGDLIAKIQIIPNQENLTRASSAVESAKINLANAQSELNRSKGLFDAGITPGMEYDNFVFQYNLRQQELAEAQKSLYVVQNGAAQNSGQVQNEVRATIDGTILGLGALTGDQIIESNTFNEGTTIVSIADMQSVYFSGKVDESEVGKLEEEMPVILSIGAIEEMTFDAALDFISPKGVDEEGTVKFTIQSSFENPDSVILRAGYSANAEIVLDKRENVLAISEGNITFSGDSIYVEVETEEQIFEKRMIEIGLSDGMMVEVLSGIDSTDRIKIPHSGTDY